MGALRELWREDGQPEHGMYSFIATKVVKNSDGKPRGGHPVSQSISDFFSKVDNDEDWFPGMHSDTHRVRNEVDSSAEHGWIQVDSGGFG